MATLSNRAKWQARRLAAHFLDKDRTEAVVRLRRAVAEALTKADSETLVVRPFPAVYRHLASAGLRWFKVPPYWFAVAATARGNVITGIFYERANIPSRIDEAQDLA